MHGVTGQDVLNFEHDDGKVTAVAVKVGTDYYRLSDVVATGNGGIAELSVKAGATK